MRQTDQIYNLLKDGRPVRTDEICRRVYNEGQLARVGARCHEIKKKYGVEIKGWKDKENPKLYWYQIYPQAKDKNKDEQLKELLQNTPLTWENGAKIKEIQEALKGSNIAKENALRKYT